MLPRQVLNDWDSSIFSVYTEHCGYDERFVTFAFNFETPFVLHLSKSKRFLKLRFVCVARSLVNYLKYCTAGTMILVLGVFWVAANSQLLPLFACAVAFRFLIRSPG